MAEDRDSIRVYLDEVASRLAGKMPKDELSELLREIQAHLRESAENLNGNEARASAAVMRFGSAKDFAANVLDGRAAQRGLWQESLWPILSLMLTLILPAVLPRVVLGPLSEPWLDLGVLLFAFACFRAGRLVSPSLAMAMAIVVLIYSAVWAGNAVAVRTPSGVDRISDREYAERSLQRQHDRVIDIQESQSKLRHGIGVFSSAKPGPQALSAFMIGGSFKGPYAFFEDDSQAGIERQMAARPPFFITVSYTWPAAPVDHAGTCEQARQAWARMGQSLLERTNENLAYEQAVLDNFPAAMNESFLPRWPRFIGELLPITLGSTAFFVAIDLLAHLLRLSIRRLRIRRIALV